MEDIGQMNMYLGYFEMKKIQKAIIHRLELY